MKMKIISCDDFNESDQVKENILLETPTNANHDSNLTNLYYNYYCMFEDSNLYYNYYCIAKLFPVSKIFSDAVKMSSKNISIS